MSQFLRAHIAPYVLCPRSHSYTSVLMTVLLACTLFACNRGKTESPQPPVAIAAAHTHENPGDTCFICDPGKRDPGRLWCREHARYEDRCWECQPQLRDQERVYCEEHGLYEDECFLCDPSRGDGGSETDVEEPHAPEIELFCNEHQVPEAECGICQPQRTDELIPGESLLIRLASARSADLAGVSVAHPIRADSSTSIQLLGEVRYDGNRLARITPLSGGVIAEVRVDVGQEVEKGAILAVVNSPGVAKAKAEYLSAKADLQLREAAFLRQDRLVDKEIGSIRAREESEALFRRAQVSATLARQKLLNLGFLEAEVERIDDSLSSNSSLYLRTPFSGTVVSRSAVLGEAVESGLPLFEVADLDEMWVELSIPEESASALPLGVPIRLSVRAQASASFDGVLTWVSPVVDEQSRMVRARGVVPNQSRVLRQGMFANVQVVIETRPNSVRLPSSAVHRINNIPYVFVRKEPDLFAARRVELGDRLSSDEFVIERGIKPDDPVVMIGGHSIKSALLAARLGAGCVDD